MQSSPRLMSCSRVRLGRSAGSALGLGPASKTRASVLNGQALEPDQQDEVATMLAVADGSLSEQQLAVWLRLNSQRM